MGDSHSNVRRAQKQALTVVGNNDPFKEAISLLEALHLTNKCKSTGEKPVTKTEIYCTNFCTNGERNAETAGDGAGVLAFIGRYGETT